MTPPSIQEVDSMQAAEYSDGSQYSPFFRQLAVHIFDVDVSSVKIPECFTDELSLQITGGFGETNPVILIKNLVPKNLQRKLRIQSTESQNHFCYMWSLWYLHHKMMGIDPMKSAKEILEFKMDPLVVIKRYIWFIFHQDLDGKKLIDEIPRNYRRFFDHHFRSIWTNDPMRTFQVNYDFNRYDVPIKDKPAPNTINDCLAASVRKVTITRAAKTDPFDAREKCKR